MVEVPEACSHMLTLSSLICYVQICSAPLILILLQHLQHQPYSEFPHVILYHLLAARSRLYSPKAVFDHIFLALDEQVSVSAQQLTVFGSNMLQ